MEEERELLACYRSSPAATRKAIWLLITEGNTEHARDLLADGYAGFDDLYAAKKGQPPAVVEVACWAHVRRKFYDVHQATRSPMAEDVLKRIGRLYDVEDEARGLPADRRCLIRQEKATPLIDELAAGLDASACGDLRSRPAVRYGTPWRGGIGATR